MNHLNHAGNFCLRPEHLRDDELLPDAQGLGDDVTDGVTQEVNVLPVTWARGQGHSVKQNLRFEKYIRFLRNVVNVPYFSNSSGTL